MKQEELKAKLQQLYPGYRLQITDVGRMKSFSSQAIHGDVCAIEIHLIKRHPESDVDEEIANAYVSEISPHLYRNHGMNKADNLLKQYADTPLSQRKRNPKDRYRVFSDLKQFYQNTFNKNSDN